MFEHIKSNFIVNKLQRLVVLADDINLYTKDKTIADFLPNCESSTYSYIYPWFDSTDEGSVFRFKINRITYIFEQRGLKSLIVIKVDDIIIFHNRSENSNEGIYEGLKAGWNHNYPPTMFKALKEDSKEIDEIINNINIFVSGKETHEQEKQKLIDIFGE